MFRALAGAQWRIKMSDIGLYIAHPSPGPCCYCFHCFKYCEEAAIRGGSRPMSAIVLCGLLLLRPATCLGSSITAEDQSINSVSVTPAAAAVCSIAIS